ncbi:hypothetical protein I5Q34_04800 [Streptomyces sp. AV19]|uniref:DUF7848 domain-containing protein n=1 Tax=Streptomyces sp. AV19 TaxID=2793068 RepID=UPI0018FE09DE|nr:hypothetical protein [Streptomyces sp. AV19]MBH1933617.1 hypothetical protein [Streptomyces sp. AV19]MDG4535877.1 hypothetical protein [Streptomyces sp. AV19]
MRPVPETEMPVTFAMHCTRCDAASVPHIDFTIVHTWAVQHAVHNSAHTAYREIHRHWRTAPAD